MSCDESTIPAEPSAIPAETSAIPAETSTIPAETSTIPTETSTIPAEAKIMKGVTKSSLSGLIESVRGLTQISKESQKTLIKITDILDKMQMVLLVEIRTGLNKEVKAYTEILLNEELTDEDKVKRINRTMLAMKHGQDSGNSLEIEQKMKDIKAQLKAAMTDTSLVMTDKMKIVEYFIKIMDQLNELSENTARARSGLQAIIANEDPTSDKIEQMITHLNQVNP